MADSLQWGSPPFHIPSTDSAIPLQHLHQIRQIREKYPQKTIYKRREV